MIGTDNRFNMDYCIEHRTDAVPTGIEINPVVPPSTYQLLGKVASIALEPSIKRILINRALHITRGEGLNKASAKPKKAIGCD